MRITLVTSIKVFFVAALLVLAGLLLIGAKPSGQSSLFFSSGGGCIPPNYCGSTSLLAVTVPTPPNAGKIAGAGTIFIDPVYGTRGVRLTDACFDPSMVKASVACPNGTASFDNGNNSYSASQSGSADELAYNIGDFLTIVANQGGTHYLVGFNPTTLALSRPYAAYTSGCPLSNCSLRGGWATNDGVEFSLGHPCKVWDTNNTALTTYTYGSDVVPWANPCSTLIVGPPAPSTVVDLVKDSPVGCSGTACNGLPSDFGNQTWTNSGGESLNDTLVTRAFASQNYYYHRPWVTLQAYGLNTQIEPVNHNANHHTFQVMTSGAAGTSGSSEPNWDLTCPNTNNTCTDGTVTWTNRGIIANQGTGFYAVIYSPTKGVMSYNTLTGSIHGDSANAPDGVGWQGGAGLTCSPTQCAGTSTAGSLFTIHNIKVNKSGNALVISPTTNVSGTSCSATNPWVWVPGTTTVYCGEGQPGVRSSGHWVLGSKGLLNDAGSPLYQYWYRLEPATGPAGAPIAVNTIPSGPACNVSQGEHGSYQSADPNDTWPFSQGRDGTNGPLPVFFPAVCAWVNEISMIDMNGSHLVHRMAFHFNTSFSIFFATQNAITELSPSGRFASVGSDWLNSSRNAAGSAACIGITTPTSTCIPNGPGWTSGYAFPQWYFINPTASNGGNFTYQAQNAGTSGVSAPVWSTSCATVGSTCSDNGIVWKNIGSPSGVNAVGTDAYMWDLQK